MSAAKYEVDDDGGELKGADEDSLGTGSVTSDDELGSDKEFDDVEGGLTDNQARLLYLTSLYTHPAETEEEDERWVRKTALMVLIYEGVVAKVFDFDYAPSSELVEGRRMYFNTSQEGQSDIDFLREEELLNGLTVSGGDHVPVTMYQISQKGLDAVRKVSRFDKEAVHKLAFSPFHSLMTVVWDGATYWLVAEEPDPDGDEYRIATSVLETEDVSYVSSAYIPACLRQGGRPTMSNAHRATESGDSNNTLRDELDVVITLNSVSVIVAEYIPYGANQMVELNYHMGATNRVQGGFFASHVDSASSGTQFKMPPGLTAVSILDYSLTNHVNFEADIRMPEAEGIVQVETFGCSINAYGTAFYGLQLEAVMDRIKDGISLDHLSRLLADVHCDSSRLIDAVLSPTQRTVMDLIFRGDGANRNKVNLIVSNEINPHLTAEEYMDKGEYENELKQVLGATRAAFDITQYDTLIFGAHGILLAGPNSRTYEPLLCAYLQYISLDLFIRNYYNRCSLLLDDVESVRNLVTLSMADPLALRKARLKLAPITRKLVVLDKLLQYVTESLEDMHCPQPPTQQAGRALYERLALPKMQMELARRITDLGKNNREIHDELELAEKLVIDVFKTLEEETQANISVQTWQALEVQKQLLRATPTHELILVCVCGSLAFEFLDRITGSWTMAEQDWFRDSMRTILGVPALWLGASILFWTTLMVVMCWWLNRRYRRALTGVISFRVQMLHKMDMPKFGIMLAKKKLFSEYWNVRSFNDKNTVAWDETDKILWGGVAPRITLEYSAHTSTIHHVVATYQRHSARPEVAFTVQELKDRVMDELKKNGVLPADPDAPPMIMGERKLALPKKETGGLIKSRKAQVKEALQKNSMVDADDAGLAKDDTRDAADV